MVSPCLLCCKKTVQAEPHIQIYKAAGQSRLGNAASEGEGLCAGTWASKILPTCSQGCWPAWSTPALPPSPSTATPAAQTGTMMARRLTSWRGPLLALRQRSGAASACTMRSTRTGMTVSPWTPSWTGSKMQATPSSASPTTRSGGHSVPHLTPLPSRPADTEHGTPKRSLLALRNGAVS